MGMATSNPSVSPTSATTAPSGAPTAADFVLVRDGTISSVSGASSFAFDVTFTADYPLTIISTCSDTRNQFNTSLILRDSTGSIVATEASPCPGNALQERIVAKGLSSGTYGITIDGLDGA